MIESCVYPSYPCIHRNLGRDDRVLSDHGRESRLPYLDECVVSTLQSFPLTSVVKMDLPRGVGDKYLLRVIAKDYCHLSACSGLVKRAIQFGTRIAKKDKARGGKAQGTDEIDDD